MSSLRAAHEALSHVYGNFVDEIVAVAQPIPLLLVGLFPAGEVRGASADGRCAVFLEPGDQLPPLPAVAVAPADEPGVLPIAVTDAYVDALDGSGARPRDTTDRDVTALDLLVRSGLGDQGPDPLERDGVPGDLAVAFPLVEVAAGLELPGERPFDRLDLREPFHPRHRIPAGNDEPQRIAVLDRERLAVHGVRQ